MLTYSEVHELFMRDNILLGDFLRRLPKKARKNVGSHFIKL